MRFRIEQVALCPRDPERAIALLQKLGMTDWVRDIVQATGAVHGLPGSNTAALAFNYQSLDAARELEVLHYTEGHNWMALACEPRVSHLGMHVADEAELDQWFAFFAAEGIPVAQEVLTDTHTNPFLLETGRKYRYVIFDTHDILGVDLKFILRRS